MTQELGNQKLILEENKYMKEELNRQNQNKRKEGDKQNSQKQSEHIAVMVDVKEVPTVKEVSEPPMVAAEHLLMIGKNRLTATAPSIDTVLICNTLEEVTILDIPEFQFKCPKCNKVFTHKGNLTKHINDHNGVSNIEVTIEDRSKATTASTITNKATKKPYVYHFQFSKVFNCDICGAVFANKALLKEHNNEKHQHLPSNVQKTLIDTTQENVATNAKRQIHCALQLTGESECQFPCETEKEMDAHIEKEHNNKLHMQCTICQLNFKKLTGYV